MDAGRLLLEGSQCSGLGWRHIFMAEAGFELALGSIILHLEALQRVVRSPKEPVLPGPLHHGLMFVERTGLERLRHELSFSGFTVGLLDMFKCTVGLQELNHYQWLTYVLALLKLTAFCFGVV